MSLGRGIVAGLYPHDGGGESLLAAAPSMWLRADMNVTVVEGTTGVSDWSCWDYPGRSAPITNWHCSDPATERLYWNGTPPPGSPETVEFNQSQYSGYICELGCTSPVGGLILTPPFTLCMTLNGYGSIIGVPDSVFFPTWWENTTPLYTWWRAGLPTATVAFADSGVTEQTLYTTRTIVTLVDGASSSGTISTYINGQLVASGGYSLASPAWGVSRMGRYTWTGGTAYFSGGVSEVIVIPRVRSSYVELYNQWAQQQWHVAA